MKSSIGDIVSAYIPFEVGTPTVEGVYACRVCASEIVNSVSSGDLLFLLWEDLAWRYVKTKSKFYGGIMGWIGPLEGGYNGNTTS